MLSTRMIASSAGAAIAADEDSERGVFGVDKGKARGLQPRPRRPRFAEHGPNDQVVAVLERALEDGGHLGVRVVRDAERDSDRFDRIVGGMELPDHGLLSDRSAADARGRRLLAVSRPAGPLGSR